MAQPMNQQRHRGGMISFVEQGVDHQCERARRLKDLGVGFPKLDVANLGTRLVPFRHGTDDSFSSFLEFDSVTRVDTGNFVSGKLIPPLNRIDQFPLCRLAPFWIVHRSTLAPQKARQRKELLH